MGCRACSTVVPLRRKGLPTIYAFGPFPNHREVDYTDLEENGSIQQEQDTEDA